MVWHVLTSTALALSVLGIIAAVMFGWLAAKDIVEIESRLTRMEQKLRYGYPPDDNILGAITTVTLYHKRLHDLETKVSKMEGYTRASRRKPS